MDIKKIEELLLQVKEDKITVPEAMRKLRKLPYEDLGFAKVDHHRALHKGFPEVIYCPGKTTEQIIHIADSMAKSGATVLATRAEPEVFAVFKEKFPTAIYHRLAKAIVLKKENDELSPLQGKVLVCAAGTADIPVADEAVLTAELMGAMVVKAYDVGVAGIHRLFDHYSDIEDARAIVAVAGMEGALPSVVGGIAACPVIAVPTSVGYGANFSGLAPLLTMLNSCASGVAVVNIDNGFGAGYMAGLINRGAVSPVRF